MISVAFIALQASTGAAGSAKRVKCHCTPHRLNGYSIRQIPSGRSANGVLALDAAEKLMDGSRRRHARHKGMQSRNARTEDLAGALIVAPNPQTKPILAELGIPNIDGVPPIAILTPGQERQHESELLPFTGGIR